MAFDYSFLYQQATTDHELTDALENGLDRMIGSALPLVFVPKDEWPVIRKNYLTAHRDELQANGEKSSAGKPQPIRCDQGRRTFGKTLWMLNKIKL